MRERGGGNWWGARGEISHEVGSKMTHIEMFSADCQSEEGKFQGGIKRENRRPQLAHGALDAEVAGQSCR